MSKVPGVPPCGASLLQAGAAAIEAGRAILQSRSGALSEPGVREVISGLRQAAAVGTPGEVHTVTWTCLGGKRWGISGQSGELLSFADRLEANLFQWCSAQGRHPVGKREVIERDANGEIARTYTAFVF